MRNKARQKNTLIQFAKLEIILKLLALTAALLLVFSAPLAGYEKEHHHCEGEHCPVCMMIQLIEENHQFDCPAIYQQAVFISFSVSSILLISKSYFKALTLINLKEKLTS